MARLGVEFDAGTKVEIGLYAQRYDLRADTVGQIIRASASIISAVSCANAAPGPVHLVPTMSRERLGVTIAKLGGAHSPYVMFAALSSGSPCPPNSP